MNKTNTLTVLASLAMVSILTSGCGDSNDSQKQVAPIKKELSVEEKHMAELDKIIVTKRQKESYISWTVLKGIKNKTFEADEPMPSRRQFINPETGKRMMGSAMAHITEYVADAKFSQEAYRFAGKKEWNMFCARCHGLLGKGIERKGPPISIDLPASRELKELIFSGKIL